MLWVCAWKRNAKLRFVSLDFRGKVRCRINEFRISFIIERVIVGHRCKPWSCTFKASKRTYGINSYVLLFVLMLSPTILSINWFFSFILLRYLDGIQRNSQASIFETQWFNEFSLFFERKTRGSGFWMILIYFVYTGTSVTVGAFHWGGDSSLTTGYEGERLGQNHWTDMPQGTRNESCGHIRKWTSGLWAWVQLRNIRDMGCCNFLNCLVGC